MCFRKKGWVRENSRSACLWAGHESFPALGGPGFVLKLRALALLILGLSNSDWNWHHQASVSQAFGLRLQLHHWAGGFGISEPPQLHMTQDGGGVSRSYTNPLPEAIWNYN